jgi:hypothetical protein
MRGLKHHEAKDAERDSECKTQRDGCIRCLSAKQPILDTKPVYVIATTRSRDWQNIYNNSVARGNGAVLRDIYGAWD